MDFSLGEELEAVRDLAREIFADRTAPERLREIETSRTRTDPRLWADLAAAGLLGAVLPERYGGAGLGLPGLAVLLTEQGRRVAPVPLWPALTGALAVAAHGSDRQRAELLPALAAGTARPTLALEEFGAAGPLAPRTAAEPEGSGWRLTGTKAVVPAAAGAAHVLVSARTDQGPGLFLLAAEAPGAAWEFAETTSHDLAAHLTLDGARGEPVGLPGGGAVAEVVRQSTVALAALQVGVAEGALGYAVGHLRERQQFGRPLGTFQAVRHQLADCSLDIEAMRVTLWQAVEARSGPDGAADAEAEPKTEAEAEAEAEPETEAEAEAERAALVAKWWAAEAGLNTVHRVQHVHGGIGVDTDYPVHRHFLWGKQIATTLGGAGSALDRLGAVLTREAVAP